MDELVDGGVHQARQDRHEADAGPPHRSSDGWDRRIRSSISMIDRERRQDSFEDVELNLAFDGDSGRRHAHAGRVGGYNTADRATVYVLNMPTHATDRTIVEADTGNDQVGFFEAGPTRQ